MTPYSDAYFEALLGADLVADIDRRVEAAPEPSARVVEAVARVWVPVIDRLAPASPVRRPRRKARAGAA